MPEPRISKITTTIPHGTDVTLTFAGEDYGGGEGPLDTKVTIEAGTLCWINWKERQAFINDLKTIIDKYAI